VNNNNQVLGQYYNQNILNQPNSNNSKSNTDNNIRQQQQPMKPNFIIPKSSSMFIESIKTHQNMLSNKFNNNLNQQPMSLDSYHHQQHENSLKQQDIQSNSTCSSVRTANIINFTTASTNNGSSPKKCLPTASPTTKSIKPILSPPPTPLMPQRNKIQYPNVNSNQNLIINHPTDQIIGSQTNVSSTDSIQTTHHESPDYETVYSGTFCRLLPPPLPPTSKQSTSSSQASPLPFVPMTPTLQKLSAAINSNHSVIKLKSVLKKKQSNSDNKVITDSITNNKNSSTSSNNKNGGEVSIATIVNNSGYDFHRAIEKLVEKMDLHHLDTSSESGYGSDQDSLTSTNSASANATATTTTSPSPTNLALQPTGTPTITVVQKKLLPTVTSPSKPPSLPPRLATSNGVSSPSPRRQPPPIPYLQSNLHTNKDGATRKKRVRFDSYVLFLQGLRERDLELVQIHVRDVCDAALATDEVVAEFLAAVIEGREAIVRELLAFGFSANTVADPTGMTSLHLAAAFNHLPLVRILLAHGASVFARAHSSAKVASALCSRQLPGYQACHAYLRCMEECLGVANSGKVYSTQSYKTTRCDELGLNCGDELVVIRKGDYNGSSWWWCCNQHGQQGYVLQDLLALNKKSNTHHNNTNSIIVA
jgi:hypothetical protein